MQLIKKLIMAILRLETRLILKKYKPFIVAVTGSVGKTSTKDAIYDVLKQEGVRVRKSEKSFNSEIGLPLTVIGAPNAWRSMSGWIENMRKGLRLIVGRAEYPKCLVLEIGADHPGDIKKVAKWLKPDVVVITKVSSTPVHVEFFKDPQQVFEEKASLAQGVKKGGSVILFADDAKVLSIADMVKGQAQVTTFGLSEAATVRGREDIVSHDEVGGARLPTGFSFKLEMDGASVPVAVRGIIGKAYMYPFLAAAAVGKARGMEVSAIAAGLASYVPPRGRMNVLAGINSSAVIDDTYNSSPDAVRVALETLGMFQCAGRKVAMLADMLELGKYSADEHRSIGREAARILGQTGILVTVGPRSKPTAEEAMLAGMSADRVQQFGDSVEAGAYAAGIVRAGDIVLVKGSQSTRMERAVKALMQDPARAPELLVRQEKEWLDKK